MLLKGRLKTDFLFSDDLFYRYFKSTEEGKEETRFATIIFALTGEGKRWVFVDFLLGMIRFLKMDFCMRENLSRWGYLVLFDFIVN